ncbi:MAG TPA: PAS domain-containing protein, partial [Solirubrobacterales bacterium]
MEKAGERSKGEGWPEGWSEERVAEFLDEVSAAGDDYRRLVERLPAIVYSCELGERGRWRYVSPQIEQILGYSPEEWMAEPGLWTERLHPEDRQRALEQETRKAASENGTGPPIDYRMITRDGRVVWILDEAVLEPDREGIPVWHGVLYDITARKQSEGELRRAAAQQAAVARLGRHALQDVDPAKLAKEVVPLMTEIAGVDAACVWEAGREGRRLHLRAGLEEHDAEIDRRASAGRDSHAGAALESGLHVIVDDWSSERRFSMPPALRVLGVRSSLAVPIAGRERPFGVLDVHATEPHRFTAKDVPFVQAAANVLADAIERHAADQALRYRVLHDS